MEIERAIEILDPNHREQYDGIEEVNEACRMGMDALKKELDAEDIITEAQREMTIYENAAEKLGRMGVIKAAASACEYLSDFLWSVSNGKTPEPAAGTGDRVVFDIAQKNARAGAEVALNMLSVVFDDCADAECEHLQELEEWIKGKRTLLDFQIE